jgi:FtsZ-binding cell division protein ZapB
LFFEKRPAQLYVTEQVVRQQVEEWQDRLRAVLADDVDAQTRWRDPLRE